MIFILLGNTSDNAIETKTGPHMKNIILATTILVASNSFALSQSIGPCDWVSSAANIVEPWEQNTRTFANGEVRIAALDTVEPAVAAFHLLVVSPPYDEVGSRQCNVISIADGIGFSGLDFASLSARYDPAIGLMFTMGVQVASADSSGFSDRIVQFSLNQATGEMQASLK